jgi:hypothetical protein
MLVFKGLNGLHVARLFSTLIHVSRMDPFIVERGSFEEFANKCIEDNLLALEYDATDIQAVLNCFTDTDKNGVMLKDKVEDLELDEIINYIKKAFKGLLTLNVINHRDLWEGYPLKEAINILMSKNPSFDIQNLLEIVNNGEKNG